MRERIAPNSHDFSMELSEAKIKIDASRAVLQIKDTSLSLESLIRHALNSVD